MKTQDKISINHLGQMLILVAVTIGCLIPFSTKPFNIDDPLFLWAARHINSYPFDFYGFNVNWYGYEMPASRIMMNPPVASYYIALAANFFGWTELALHLAFLLPAVSAALGTYMLAREYTTQPLAASLICVLTPVFLLSSTTVMCDTMMLSSYVWSVFLWVRGMKTDKVAYLVFASFLIAFCGLTKYFGISLIPLLLVYSLTTPYGKKHHSLLLLIPVLFLLFYQWVTNNLYGRGLLLDAVAYATLPREGSSIYENLFIGLCFTGGCLVSALFFSPLLWSGRFLASAAVLIVTGTISLAFTKVFSFSIPPSIGFTFQFCLLLVAGINILFLAGYDLWKRRTADSILLFLWTTGTFIFATFVNWTINGRSLLPMAPPAGILLMRRLEENKFSGQHITIRRTLPHLFPALVLSMLVVWADYKLAVTSRTAATEISRIYNRSSGILWFQGHWGFQYYMESLGGKPFDLIKPLISPGDIVVIPGNNTNIDLKTLKGGVPRNVLHYAPVSFLTTINGNVGAGYYSRLWGPLPFFIGPIPDETYLVLDIVRRS